MQEIGDKTWLVDLEHLGVAEKIGSTMLEGRSGAALVDPGPASTLPQLRKGLAVRGLTVADVQALILTHIHLDHAGASGTLVRENPKIRVYVHGKGAPHLVAPEKLLKSAARLYRENMDRFWGEFLPVPEKNLQVLRGDEVVEFGGRRLESFYTPGHAVHHVAYLDAHTGLAFVGDAAGERISNNHYVMPATPPPDISLEQLEESLQKIEARKPARLVPTHFGPSDDWGQHLERYRKRLAEWSKTVRRSVAQGGEEAGRKQAFLKEVEAGMREWLSKPVVDHYVEVGSLELCWLGLHRYWRKRLERG